MTVRDMIVVIVCVVSTLLVQCGTNPTHAEIGDSGGGGGIETQAVRGQILDSTGVPAPLVGVTARSAEDVYSSNEPTGADVSYVVNTNEQGGFAFSRLPLGTYLFEAFIDSGHGVVFYDNLDGKDEELWVGTKRASGTVALHLMVLPEGIDSSITLKASILGLNKHASAVLGEPLRFSNLPPTVYTVRIGSSRPAHTGTADISVEVRSDTAVTIVRGVGLPVHYRADSLAVSAFLNAQGVAIADPGSVTNRWNNRIRSLNLRSLGITEITSAIGSLTFLQSLDLGANPLTSLPAELVELDELHYLMLDSTDMEVLPHVVGTLDALRGLDISDTRISALPDDIGRLKHLAELSMENTGLSNVPSQVFTLSALQNLRLSGNRITSIPEDIERLHSLRILDLSDNELSVLANGLTGCILLEEFYANRNFLSELPANFPFLTSLRVLSLHGNQLTGLPVEFGRLTSLTRLDLGENALANLPSSIVNITRLAELEIGGNKLCDLNGATADWLSTNDPDWNDDRQNCE